MSKYPYRLDDNTIKNAKRRMKSSGKTRFQEELNNQYGYSTLEAWLKIPDQVPWNIRSRDQEHPVVHIIEYYIQAYMILAKPIGDPPDWWGKYRHEESYEDQTKKRNQERVEFAEKLWQDCQSFIEWDKLTPKDSADILDDLNLHVKDDDFYLRMVDMIKKAGVSFDRIQNRKNNIIFTPTTYLLSKSSLNFSFWLTQPEPLENPKQDNGVLYQYFNSYLFSKPEIASILHEQTIDAILKRKPSALHLLQYPKEEKDSYSFFPKKEKFKTPFEMAVYHEVYKVAEYAKNLNGDLDDQHIEILKRVFEKIKDKSQDKPEIHEKRITDLNSILNYPTFNAIKWYKESQNLLTLYAKSILSSKNMPEKSNDFLRKLLDKGCSFNAPMEKNPQLIQNLFSTFASDLPPEEAFNRFTPPEHPDLLYTLSGIKKNSVEPIEEIIRNIWNGYHFRGMSRSLLVLEKICENIPSNKLSWDQNLNIEALIFGEIPRTGLVPYEINQVLNALENKGWKPTSEAWAHIRQRCLHFEHLEAEYMVDSQAVLLHLTQYLVDKKVPVDKELFNIHNVLLQINQTKFSSSPLYLDRKPSTIDGYKHLYSWNEDLAFDTHAKMIKMSLPLIADINHSDEEDPSILQRFFSPFQGYELSDNATPLHKKLSQHLKTITGFLLDCGANPYEEPYKPLASHDDPNQTWADVQKNNPIYNRFHGEEKSQREQEELKKQTPTPHHSSRIRRL